jgi:hypothetical protein
MPEVYLEDSSFQDFLQLVEPRWQELRDETSNLVDTTRNPSDTRLPLEFLSSLGDPFRSDLLPRGKQRVLTGCLIWAHKNRGLTSTIQKLVKVLLDIDANIQGNLDTSWKLGSGKLGATTSLFSETGGGAVIISVPSNPSADAVTVIRSIVDYIKPASHYYRLLVLDGGFGLGSFGMSSFGG